MRYRRRYVDFIIKEAPRRAVLAVQAEIARFAALAFFAGLCALFFWPLVVGTIERGSVSWAIFAIVLALGSSVLVVAAFVGICEAALDLRRVRSLVNG